MAQRLTPAACSIIARSIVIVHSLQLGQLMGVIETTAAEMVRKLTLMDSLHMQKEVQSRVTTSTVINCYRRASFVRETSEAVTDSDKEEGDVPVLPAGVTSQEFNEYVAVDDGL